MLDITHLIFESTVWLFVGILLYYILSSAKVFLLVNIQPQLFHSYGEAPKLTIGKLLLQYINQFAKDRLLHRYTANYLMNKGGKGAWKLVGNKKINFYYNFLNTITVLVKPFLLIAVVWAILKFLIWKRIAYDELQMTLGQIQTTIAYLKSLTIVDNFDHYKFWLFIFIIVVCGFLGVIKKLEKKISRSKAIIYLGFTILSILAGLTFFGSDFSNTKSNSLKKLRELDLEVKNIHENIYRDVAEAVVYEDLAEAIKDDVNNNEKESQRLDTLYNKAFEIISRQEIRSELSEKFNTQKEEYKRLITLEVAPRTYNQNNPETEFVFSNFMEDYFHKNQSNNGTQTENYWSKRDNWSKGVGLKYLKSADELKSQQYFSGETESQVHTVVENIVDYLGEEIMNKVAEFLGIETLELPKSVVSFLAIEKCKECFVPRIANVVKSLGNKSQAINSLKTFFCFKKQRNSGERINSIKAEHDKQYNRDLTKAKRDQQIANANEKAESLIKEKITDIVRGYSPVNSDAYDEFINKAVGEYKREVGTENLSEKSYNKLISISQLPDGVLRGVLANVRTVHPFPAPPECPICAFQIGLRLLR
jgi:hypothetical protein